jgi:DNA-binding Lrp family transcriptional regulator
LSQNPARRKKLAVRGYILVRTEIGHSKSVGEALVAFKHPDAKITSVDTVTGPFDVIVQLEAESLDKLGSTVSSKEGIAGIPGVETTTTCLAVRLS